LTFTPTDAAAIAQGRGPSAFGTIVMGRFDGTGLIRTTAALALDANLDLFSSEAFGAGLNISNNIILGNAGDGHDLMIDGGPVVVSGQSTNLQTNGGNLSITGVGRPGSSGGIGVKIDAATLDSGFNGSLSLRGTGAAGQRLAVGVAIGNG